MSKTPESKYYVSFIRLQKNIPKYLNVVSKQGCLEMLFLEGPFVYFIYFLSKSYLHQAKNNYM